MSLLGVDIGSSAIKAAAYRADGKFLIGARAAFAPKRERPGWWELNPEEVWEAARSALTEVARSEPVRRDPPQALAVSASGREAFPVDQTGKALGPCLMAADTRGEEMEALFAGRRTPEEWVRACGHLPERMDPALRLLWWRRNRPQTMARAARFVGWHEFLTLRLGGRAVTDRSLAGKWLCYDLVAGGWSNAWLEELEVEPSLLPEVHAWGTAEVTVRPEMAAELGLPPGLPIAVGCFDASCAGLGIGASDPGVAALLCGSWEGLIVPMQSQIPRAPHELALRAMSLGPHPGPSGMAVFALSPNGTAVVDWARELVNLPLDDLEARLAGSGAAPSPVLAIPHLSGATVPWPGARWSRGIVAELTLATSATDVVKAFMEGIAYDLALTLAMLRDRGIGVHTLRVAGGGTRSEWWMQLKSDLTGLPLETTDLAEPGTYGAARLAGVALGIELGPGQVSRRCEPDGKRAAMHSARLSAYQAAVSELLMRSGARRSGVTPRAEPGEER